MAASLTCAPDAVFTGGVARNTGMKKYLETELKRELLVPDKPQIIGALGAALIARRQLSKIKKNLRYTSFLFFGSISSILCSGRRLADSTVTGI